MKKVYIILSATILTLAFTKCKPAAEDRFKMHENAKRISDSIGRVIDAAMAEVAIQSKDGATIRNTESQPAVNGSLLSFSGNGKKSSSVFTLSGKSAKLKYKYKSPSNQGAFSVYVLENGVDLQKSGGFAEVETEKSEESESTIHKSAGSYYLLVNAVGSWTVDVIEE